MKRSLRLLPFGIAFGVLLAKCASPTAIRVVVQSEVSCEEGGSAVFVGGKSLRELAEKAPASTSRECLPNGTGTQALGEIVIVPDEGKSDEVAFQIMVRADRESAERCGDPANAAECIVSRRQIRFSPGDELRMRVDLRLSCKGVLCPFDQTCIRGACVPASVPSATCLRSICDETSLDPNGAIDAGIDGAATPDGGVAPDAPTDARIARTPVALAAGLTHTCALSDDGSVTCWGGPHGRVPVDIAGLNARATAIAAGGLSTCALLAPDGNVKCWGKNESGQLGNQTYEDSLTPVDVLALTATKIAVGDSHACAVVSNGDVFCFGLNTNRQLGAGTTASTVNVPARVLGLPSPATSVSAGGIHTCALVSGGELHCWGGNSNGQLGNNSTTDSPTPVSIPFAFPFASVVAGTRHTCAIVADSNRACWGKNAFGELGAGDTNETHAPAILASTVTFNAMYLGGSPTAGFGCGRTSQNAAWCWGYGGDGRLGYPTDAGYSDEPALVTNLTGAPVSTFALGDAHTCALVSGRIKCWGNNAQGQLGNDSTVSSATPIDVTLP